MNIKDISKIPHRYISYKTSSLSHSLINIVCDQRPWDLEHLNPQGPVQVVLIAVWLMLVDPLEMVLVNAPEIWLASMLVSTQNVGDRLIAQIPLVLLILYGFSGLSDWGGLMKCS